LKKIIALIPARKKSTRLPNKMLQKLGDDILIVQTYKAVANTGLFADVIVVTDNEEIKTAVEKSGGKAMMTSVSHQSGTDRIAEAAQDIEADIIVNIQGDEPFISKEPLDKLIKLFDNEKVEVASLKMKITELEKINNPNCVKVVTDLNGRAMYFSRSAIPFCRDENEVGEYFQHIGVYAFTKDALLRIAKLPVSNLENIEKLENLRMLENGINIYLAETNHIGISIDTAEDLEKARLLF
jgi:3-deoxy-manno-octulosonate cytidylyltransferase (CMP-KDO synthetase)